jgi:membrane-associated phospholipid phosphatase
MRPTSTHPSSNPSRFFAGLAFLLALLGAPSAHAEDCPSFPWQHFGDTATEFVRPLPLILVAGAGVAPVVFAPTGLDHDLRLVAQRDLGGRHDIEPVSVYAPYVLGGGVLVGYVVTLAVSACDAQRPQAAMLQAMALSLATTALLKFSVGRQWPNAGLDPTAPDRLRHPEFAEHFSPFDRYGAWPSGHTGFFFAAASALRTSAPELGVVRWVGYPLSLGVAAGMWIGDHHWASDIVSGALLGEAIGSSVGRGFASTNESEALEFGVVPVRSGLVVQVHSVW